jgi:tetratricopeptide (TPR) repeat protein
MEYQEYLRLGNQAAQFIQESRLKEAVDAFYKLYLSDVSDIDKSLICATMAGIYDRMGNTDEAIEWFDKGMATEEAYCRYEVAEKKAQYLSQIGRNKDAVAIYEKLRKQAFVSETEKERMRKMIQALLGKAMREWQ